ncbi:MAG: hypothetical protein M3Y56_07945 [Armatimonadota bacterium]|nr:hypothetical protein [Armatimonadota bacterium]
MNNPDRPPIPQLEVSLLLNTVDQALDMVLSRRPIDGAKELHYGLRRMDAALEDSEPWAPEMIERWRTALTNYCFQHRIAIRDIESVG